MTSIERTQRDERANMDSEPAATSAPDLGSESIPAPPAPPTARKRRGLWITLAVVGVLLVVGLCAGVALVVGPVLKQGGAVADEWQTRLAKEYPGWRIAGFNVLTISSSTQYDFALIPPGRDFSVGVSYLSEDGKPAVSQDYVLRPGSQYSSRAASLLDFIHATYVKSGKTVGAVTSTPDGSVTVNWRQTTQIGPLSSSVGSFDKLSFDDSTKTWSATPGPQP